MKKFKEKGFTLIELIAVLVIMAIIALIVTPLVMSIIRKARISADKRSIDAYGRSIELAIAGYLLDNGSFPTSIEQLTIEYSGDEVVCSTTNLNSDSSVYLAGCTVGGRSVEGYTYGKEETVTYDSYEIGDEITYNNVNYYVIKDSSVSESTVTLLKSEPLSYEEVQTYSAGTGAQITSFNSYGALQYHSNSNHYLTSYLKIVVDAWANENVLSGLQEARLLTIEDLVDNFGYIYDENSQKYNATSSTPRWIKSGSLSNLYIWTMSPYSSDNSKVWYLIGDIISKERVSMYYVGSGAWGVRPVITISKSEL